MNASHRIAAACGLGLLMMAPGAAAQIQISGATTTVDFTGFAGDGIVASPGTGQLSSLAWAVTGLSDGDLAFGADGTTGDFARGASPGGVTTGGVYAFDTGGGDVCLGIQPTGNDFVPGTLTARFENALSRPLKSFDVSYRIWVLADQARSSSFTFSYSTDNVTFTAVPDLDYTTIGPIPTTPEWRSYDKSTTLALDVAEGDYLYLRFSSDDVGGSGSRDELGLDDLVLQVNRVCGDGLVEAPEECDDGNDSNDDACLADCTAASCGDGFIDQSSEDCDPSSGEGDATCCSFACQFADGATCGGGTCRSGVCEADGAGGQAGDTSAAGATTEPGSGGASGEPASGGASGSNGGTTARGGSGNRPGKGDAGTSTGVGGSVGTGGSTAAGGTNGGASAGTSSGDSAGKTSSSTAPADSKDSGGCGCEVPRGSTRSRLPLTLGFVLLAYGAARRRARRATRAT